ncbi:MAG: endonuclease/exonuclease/phosphatase family protein [Bacteroidales bacterium]|nr:endonuclease/exonuclease/phosphatase family protein [Candidatus Sodaliphilus aphodohippi]
MTRKFTTIFALLLIALSAAAATRITTGCYNIRYDNKSDRQSGHAWKERCPIIAQLVQFHDFEIFGTEEGLYEQLEDLKGAMPGWNYIGSGRDDGKREGEHAAIFYRTDLFEVVDHGDFWLSEHPDKPGLGWDAVCYRICTWGHFRVKATGFEFLYFNLHLDHIGVKARIESVKLVQQKMKEFGTTLPAMLSGDFNIDQFDPSYKVIAQSEVLKDSYEKAEFRYVLNGTYNAYDASGWNESRIDHFFLSPSFRVLKYGVLTDTYRAPVGKDSKGNTKYEARTPSDHYPIKIVIEHP